MRHKLSTNSTMKTITYVFFIYVSITAFDGISAEQNKQNKITEPHQNLKNPIKSQCDLQSMIKKSKYVVPCLNITTNGSLPKMDYDTRNQYLCTRIFGTVDKICKLNLASINLKSFVADIEKLRSSLEKNVTKFCSLVNETLIPRCDIFCNDLTKPGIVDSMCIVFHWTYNILVTPKTQVEHEKKNLTPSEGSQPAAGTTANEAKTDTSNVQDSKDETKKTDSISSSTLEQEEINETVDLSIKISEQKDNKEKHDLKEKVSKTADNTEAGTPPGHENTDKNGEKSPVRKPVGSLVGQEVAGVDTKPATHSAGKKQSEGIEVEENSLKLNEGEEGNIEDPVLPPTDPETTVSHQLARTVPASNPGKDDKHGSSGKDKVDSEQGSIAPQEHSPVHAGLPDPPQHFFAYFMAVSFICILCYIGYHKKHKIMGIIFEGRKSRGGRGRRRPNTAGYRKLDCNLEEAVTSQCNSNVTHVIY